MPPPGFSVTHFAEIGSTNDAAKDAAGLGAVDGSVFWTGHQTAGRGTHGREWAAPPGNLACSILMRPRLPIRFAPQAALVTTIAVADALVSLGLPSSAVKLKWPNDVLVEGAKIAGILLEAEAQGPSVKWLVVGTGLNLRHHPAGTRHKATNLARQGLDIAPEQALEAYLTLLQRWWMRWRRYDFSVIATAWSARTLHQPGDVLQLCQGEIREPVAYRRLSDEGALVVEGPDRLDKHIVSAEVFTDLPL